VRLDLRSGAPLYSLVERDLAEAIQQGSMAPGAQLPAEEELCRRYGVSRTTVRKAVEELGRRGLIEIRRGKGTFVCGQRIVQELSWLTGFVEDMVALGRHPSARVLERGIVAASAEVASQLGLATGAEVVRIRRVRLADEVPISLDETYLPLPLGRQILEDDLELYPIFSLLEERYHTPLLEADYRLEATAAGDDVAAALGIAAGSPILLIERASFGIDGQPVDYEKLHYRGDQVRFSTRLRRNRRSHPLADLQRRDREQSSGGNGGAE
jgi:GntR family transcriptional regulator